MKKRVFPFSALVLMLLVAVIIVPALSAAVILNASCSSQIAEAFGREALEEFMVANNIKVKLHTFSSEKSIERLKNGFSNFAGITTKLSREDKEAGLIQIPICKDPMVVITNKQCRVKNLTLNQVRQIFSGYITNWKEVGGDDRQIILVIPDKQTGAYKNFKQLAMGAFEIKEELIAAQTYMALNAVENIPGAISFIAHGIAIQHIKDLNVMHIDGVSPADSDYPYYQTFSIVYRGEPDHIMKETIKYMVSDKAVGRMKDRGMTPLVQ